MSEGANIRSKCSIKAAMAFQYFRLLTHLSPIGGEGACPALNVAHAKPGQESRAREVVLDFRVVKADLAEQLIPHIFLT